MWNITIPENKTAATVWNTGINPDGSFDEICGSASVPDPNFPGELAVGFGSRPPPPIANYLVIGYDYDNYASIYNCAFGIELAWVLTRSQAPSEDVASLKNKTISLTILKSELNFAKSSRQIPLICLLSICFLVTHKFHNAKNHAGHLVYHILNILTFLPGATLSAPGLINAILLLLLLLLLILLRHFLE
jgi:hypothetical protein